MNEHRGSVDPQLPAQVTILVNVPWIWGAKEIGLTPAQAARYATEPQAVVAEALGVTYEDYLVWLSWGGAAQCQAVTGKGHRCRGTVPGVRFDNPAGLVAYGGGYCTTHADVTAR